MKWKMQLEEKVRLAKKKNKGRLQDLLNTLITIDKTLHDNPEKELLM